MIRLAPNTITHVIHHTGKGSLPKSLEGKWTTEGMAKKQIDEYLDKKKDIK